MAAEKNMSAASEMRRMARQDRIRHMFRKLRMVARGDHRGAIDTVKVPKHEWLYHPESKELFRYSAGAFYVHSRCDELDDENMMYSPYATRKPLSERTSLSRDCRIHRRRYSSEVME